MPKTESLLGILLKKTEVGARNRGGQRLHRCYSEKDDDEQTRNRGREE